MVGSNPDWKVTDIGRTHFQVEPNTSVRLLHQLGCLRKAVRPNTLLFAVKIAPKPLLTIVTPEGKAGWPLLLLGKYCPTETVGNGNVAAPFEFLDNVTISNESFFT